MALATCPPAMQSDWATEVLVHANGNNLRFPASVRIITADSSRAPLSSCRALAERRPLAWARSPVGPGFQIRGIFRFIGFLVGNDRSDPRRSRPRYVEGRDKNGCRRRNNPHRQ